VRYTFTTTNKVLWVIICHQLAITALPKGSLSIFR